MPLERDAGEERDVHLLHADVGPGGGRRLVEERLLEGGRVQLPDEVDAVAGGGERRPASTRAHAGQQELLHALASSRACRRATCQCTPGRASRTSTRRRGPSRPTPAEAQAVLAAELGRRATRGCGSSPITRRDALEAPAGRPARGRRGCARDRRRPTIVRLAASRGRRESQRAGARPTRPRRTSARRRARPRGAPAIDHVRRRAAGVAGPGAGQRHERPPLARLAPERARRPRPGCR